MNKEWSELNKTMQEQLKKETTFSELVSTIKICQTKNFAGSFVFSKSQRKWERLSARGKNGKEKPLLHGLLAFMKQRFVLGLFS